MTEENQTDMPETNQTSDSYKSRIPQEAIDAALAYMNLLCRQAVDAIGRKQEAN